MINELTWMASIVRQIIFGFPGELLPIEERPKFIPEPEEVRDERTIFSIDEQGNSTWKKWGRWHREDGPSFISKDGHVQHWNINGNMHREGAPAYIDTKRGIEMWVEHSLGHRDHGLPQLTWRDPKTNELIKQEWMVGGGFHRWEGPAKIQQGSPDEYWLFGNKVEPFNAYVLPSGIRRAEWRNKNGRLHSVDDQPAIIDEDGCKFWFHDGRLHRDGGRAAIVRNCGRNEIWIHGRYQADKKA